MSLRDQMRQQAAPVAGGGDYPDAIKWTTPGQEVCGPVTDVRLVQTAAGSDWVVEVDDEQSGPVSMWCSTIALKNALIQGANQVGRQVAPGDQVYIRFDGKQPTPNGNTMNTYSVFVQDGSGAPQATPAAAPQPQQAPAPAPQQAAPQAAPQPQTAQTAAAPAAGQQWAQPAQAQAWPTQQAPAQQGDVPI